MKHKDLRTIHEILSSGTGQEQFERLREYKRFLALAGHDRRAGDIHRFVINAVHAEKRGVTYGHKQAAAR